MKKIAFVLMCLCAAVFLACCGRSGSHIPETAGSSQAESRTEETEESTEETKEEPSSESPGLESAAETGIEPAGTDADAPEKESSAKDGETEDEDRETEASASDGNFHIAIVTASVSQSEEERRGAEAFQKRYGDERVQLLVYPDNFADQPEEAFRDVLGLCDDPDMKAIIVNEAIPGTAEAFRKIKAQRPDILCIAGETHEAVQEIGDAADLLCNSDFVSRGYLIIHTAHELGCDTFVHLSFPRHMANKTISRRAAIMQEACKDFGMNFVMETVPDPASDVGVAAAQAYITQNVHGWLEKYGQKSAFFSTNDALVEPLLDELLEFGGYFIEADLPSPLLGYPEALGLGYLGRAGGYESVLPKVEEAVCTRGGAGRFGTWTYSFGYTMSAGLAQHAMNVLDGESALDSLEDLCKAFELFSPGSRWKASHYIDPDTGKQSENVCLLFEDTYIMGDPGRYMGTTGIEVPEKYFTVKWMSVMPF